MKPTINYPRAGNTEPASHVDVMGTAAPNALIHVQLSSGVAGVSLLQNTVAADANGNWSTTFQVSPADYTGNSSVSAFDSADTDFEYPVYIVD